jgi:hypothetical protein
MITNRFRSFLCLGALALVACGRKDPPPQVGMSDQPRPSGGDTAATAPGAAEATAPTTGDDSTPSGSRAGNPDRSSIASVTDTPGSQAGTSDAEPSGNTPTEARTPDVIYVPTPQPVVDKMLEMAQVKKTDVVYDLGCGDGRIVVTAAKRYGTKAFGFDIDPERVKEARANVKAAKVEHLVTIEQKDIFTLDLSPANVVTLYLLPKLNVRLIPQLEKLKPGSRIVSHDFNMEGVKPLKHLTMTPAGSSDEHEIYLWKTPLVKETGKTSEPSTL